MLWSERDGNAATNEFDRRSVRFRSSSEGLLRTSGTEQQKDILEAWPVNLPANWLTWVNRPQTAAEEADMGPSIERNRPFGEARWQQAAAKRLGLTSCFRNPGRPKKMNRSKQ